MNNEKSSAAGQFSQADPPTELQGLTMTRIADADCARNQEVQRVPDMAFHKQSLRHMEPTPEQIVTLRAAGWKGEIRNRLLAAELIGCLIAGTVTP